MHELWTKKYNPSTLDTYVFQDDNQRLQCEKMIETQTIPHLLLSGATGIGKTTLAKILIAGVGVQDIDVLEINASRENSVDGVRKQITSFVETMPFGSFKIVLLDEVDFLSLSAQAALRGVMESHSDSARFILTCNHPNKIMDAVIGRCQHFHMETLSKEAFENRIVDILLAEDVLIDDGGVLQNYIDSTYPDMRSCINLLQLNSMTGTLMAPTITDSSTYKFKVVDLIKEGKLGEARSLLCSQATVTDINNTFRWMYDNLELWGDTSEQQDKSIRVIRDGLVNHAMVADVEINLSATMVELCQIRKEV